MLYKLFRAVLNLILSLFYTLISLVMKLLVLLIQLVVIIALLIYFLVTYWLPTKRYNPFSNAIKYERMAFLDTLDHNGRILYLDLDNTLVYCSRVKPKTRDFIKVPIRAVADTNEVVYYLLKRPYLQEFLREVS